VTQPVTPYVMGSPTGNNGEGNQASRDPKPAVAAKDATTPEKKTTSKVVAPKPATDKSPSTDVPQILTPPSSPSIVPAPVVPYSVAPDIGGGQNGVVTPVEPFVIPASAAVPPERRFWLRLLGTAPSDLPIWPVE
jgi:hypothetical protein